MKRFSRKLSIVLAEIVVFAAMLLVIWLDEFIDMPYHLFGAPPTPYRLAEYIIETVSCSVVGIVVIIGTLLILKRLERLEQSLRVCAWCRKVWLDGRWVSFEEYMSKQHTLSSTHGVCPECVEMLIADSPAPQAKP